MHVDAFFDYLLENPHPYWTDIPADANPVSEGGRDGVAAEDDMALRSLLPHIRPRRGRKRPDDVQSLSRSPSQKPRMEPGEDHPSISGPAVEHLDLWTGQPGARSSAYLFAQDQFTRMDIGLGNTGAWSGEDFTQTPMTAHPYSTATPASTNAFWPDQAADPKSANTPSKPKTNRRHGAKVVSSAWRSGGPSGTGKTRGRPPLNRQNTGVSQTRSEASAASPFSAFPSAQSDSPPTTFRHPPHPHSSPHMMDASLTHSMMTLGSAVPDTTIESSPQHGMRMQGLGYDVSGHHGPAQTRELRTSRSRLSLQVPDRIGADVRLATAQGQQASVMMANGAMTTTGDQASIMAHHHQSINTGMTGSGAHMMDPFGPAAAAQSIYNMQFQQQQQAQHPHQHVQHLRHTSQDASPLYSTTTAATHQSHHSQHQSPPQTLFQQPTPGSVTGSVLSISGAAPNSGSGDGGGGEAPAATDRTNIDGLESLLTYELLDAVWCDAQGNRIPTCGVDEATAVAQEIIENVRREAGSAQSLLMNLSAIAGTTWLKGRGARTRVYRVGEVAEEQGRRKVVYNIHWDLQLGDVRSNFSLREVVGYDGWEGKRRSSHQGSRRGRGEESDGEEEDAEGEDDDNETSDMIEEEDEGDSAERWRQRYRGLLDVVQEQRAEMSGVRRGMLDLCRSRARRGRGDDAGDAAGQSKMAVGLSGEQW